MHWRIREAFSIQIDMQLTMEKMLEQMTVDWASDANSEKDLSIGREPVDRLQDCQGPIYNCTVVFDDEFMLGR